jgi:hypothetical protein
MIARCASQPRDSMLTAVSSPAAPNLASIIKGVYHMNVPLLLVHLCTLPALYVDDRTLWRHSRETAC